MRGRPPAAGWAALAVAWLLAGVVPGAAHAARGAPFPVTIVDDRGHAVVLTKPAMRIVSMLPSVTETVCALDACGRLVGVDRSSDFPAQVRGLPRVGGLDDTHIERIVALRPDLVLAPSSSRAIDRLEGLGLRVLALEPKGYADTRRVLDAIAAALGTPHAGDALWRSIDARIDAAAARVPPALRGARVYFEVSDAPHAASAGSFVGETLARLGLDNVVPATLGPFPQLNPEFVVRAAPELVMASERSLARMASRPGWGAMAALRAQRGCGFAQARYDVLVRPGPRLGEAADTIADCLAALGPGPR
jgi:iron complex transport system substrate-binding protein